MQDPPRQTHRARRRFRTTSTERTRAPSIGWTRTSRPGRALSRSLFTCTASPRTLSPATSPARLVKGWEVASGYPARARILVSCPTAHLAGEKDASLRLLQPTCDTSTLRTARFPSPLAAPLPFGRGAHRRRPALGQRPRANPRVELRLTANLQLRPGCGSHARARGLAPIALVTRRCTVLAEHRSNAPPRCATRPRRSRPRAEPACMASDVLCRRLARTRSDLSVEPARRGDQARCRDRLVKDDRFVEPGRLPSTSAPSPAPAESACLRARFRWPRLSPPSADP